MKIVEFRKTIALIIAISIILSIGTIPVNATTKSSIYVYGEKVVNLSAPYFIYPDWYVPVVGLLNALGTKCTYNSERKQATFKNYRGSTIVITAGKNTYLEDGYSGLYRYNNLSWKAELKNGIVFVPSYWLMEQTMYFNFQLNDRLLYGCFDKPIILPKSNGSITTKCGFEFTPEHNVSYFGQKYGFIPIEQTKAWLPSEGGEAMTLGYDDIMKTPVLSYQGFGEQTCGIIYPDGHSELITSEGIGNIKREIFCYFFPKDGPAFLSIMDKWFESPKKATNPFNKTYMMDGRIVEILRGGSGVINVYFMK